PSKLFEAFKKLQDNFSTSLYRKRKDGRMADGVMSELVVVVDEARCLLTDGDKELNPFRRLRRALKSLTCKNCVFIFVDTLSSITNFCPASIWDPSARPIDSPKLLQPFYDFNMITKPPLLTNHIEDK